MPDNRFLRPSLAAFPQFQKAPPLRRGDLLSESLQGDPYLVVVLGVVSQRVVGIAVRIGLVKPVLTIRTPDNAELPSILSDVTTADVMSDQPTISPATFLTPRRKETHTQSFCLSPVLVAVAVCQSIFPPVLSCADR